MLQLKTKMLIIILTALLVFALNACHNTSDDTLPKEDNASATTTETSTVKDAVESTPITDADSIIAEESIPCNGNDDIRILCNIKQRGDLTLRIDNWNEDHLVAALPLSSDTEIFVFKRSVKKAIALTSQHACLFLAENNEITVIRFEKGSAAETVTTLEVSEEVINIKANFINDTLGYVFTFKEVSEGHARGGAKLSSLFLTEDGGNTWSLIDLQNAPSIALQNHIIYAKMITKEVGLISGDIAAGVYDFCERTLLTTDSGLNWVNLSDLPGINDLKYAKVTDFTKVDDSYVLTVRYTVKAGLESGSTYGFATYQLIDLNTWIRIN